MGLHVHVTQEPFGAITRADVEAALLAVRMRAAGDLLAPFVERERKRLLRERDELRAMLKGGDA